MIPGWGHGEKRLSLLLRLVLAVISQCGICALATGTPRSGCQMLGSQTLVSGFIGTFLLSLGYPPLFIIQTYS
jgi:hypothetical protein